MRRNTTFALAIALSAVGACSFPNASFAPDDASAPSDTGEGIDRTASSSSGGSGGSSSGSDASGDRTAGGDSSSDVGGGDTSASSSGSSSGSSGSSSGSNPCDKDNDTYLAKSCGGNDCCDTDPNAHPNQTNFFPQQDACLSFDYNCDMMETQEWGLFSCSVGVGCTATPGFISGPPACGVMQPWTSMCQYMVTTCSAGTTSNQTQACN